MTKEILLRLPDHIHKIIKEFKDISGVSQTNFIYNAIVWYMATRGLISLDYLRCTKEEEKKNE
ncbi:MAG: hypothetical protein GY853_00660 [PVC group bacterium]|nr:hypothetical protein [PVC group bacterium]